MDIKNINEHFSKFLNKTKQNENTGFAVGGNKQEVNDILAKLDQEYGDLTIPEFIDLMIKKEEQGEDVLDESLNEDLSFTSLKEELFSTLMKKIKGIKLPFITSPCRYSNKMPQKYENVKFSCERTYNNVIAGKTNISMFDSVGHGSLEDIYDGSHYTIGIYDIKKDGATDPYRKELQVVIEYPVAHGNPTLINSWKTFSTRLEYRARCWQLTIDIEDDELNLKSIIKDIINMFTAKYENEIEAQKAQEQEKQDKYNAATNEFEELARARREARANKNAANTTVRQALSKSGIAKKIRNLQNPTQEQLAKILAAIDVQESVQESITEQKEGIVFNGKDEEFLKELMRKFGPETTLKKVLEQIKK